MIKDKDNVTLEDVLQPGTNMLAAGYCMYGSSCTVIESSKPVFPQHNLLLSVPI
jgi:fructose-1,6-bisphosphatase I